MTLSTTSTVGTDLPDGVRAPGADVADLLRTAARLTGRMAALTPSLQILSVTTEPASYSQPMGHVRVHIYLADLADLAVAVSRLLDLPLTGNRDDTDGVVDVGAEGFYRGVSVLIHSFVYPSSPDYAAAALLPVAIGGRA